MVERRIHHMPLSGGDRKALKKELAKSRGISTMLSNQSIEARAQGEALIREADSLLCQSWNETMWRDGGPAQPSPTIAQSINGGFPSLEVKCASCQSVSGIDLRELKRPADTEIWRLEASLKCSKCSTARRKASAVLWQLKCNAEK